MAGAPKRTPKAKGVKEGISHKTYAVEMTVINSDVGIAKFDGEHPELTHTSSKEFKNTRFRAFVTGQKVEATFRKSERGRRNLVHVRAIGDSGSGPLEGNLILGHYIEPEIMASFAAIETIAKREGKAVLAILGGSGYGKTSMAEVYAKISEKSFARIDCSVVKNPEDWFGRREAEDGSTLFKLSRFAEKLTEGNTVICLDEVNRLEPWALNSLFPLLDHAGETHVAGMKFEVGKNTVFALTMNIGYEYTGTFELDEAFNRRIQITTLVRSLPPEAEATILVDRTDIGKPNAVKIVELAKDIRHLAQTEELRVDCSTRATINVALVTNAEVPIRAAFAFVLENGIKNLEQRKKITDVLNHKLGAYNPDLLVDISKKFMKMAEKNAKS